MKHFTLGVIVGSLLTGVVAGAATFYDSNGQPNAPSRINSEFDYFPRTAILS